jgi:AcrR family transcriptional regulator
MSTTSIGAVPPAAGASTPRRRNRRGEATRQAILDAAVTCLQRTGYAATSIEAVMSESGIGRGSLLNQFPNRLELMAGVAEFAMTRMVAHARTQLSAMDDPRARLFALAEMAWQSHNLPESTAVTEILLASRWDEQLAVKVRDLAKVAECDIDRLNLALARESGIADIPGFLVLGRLLNSTLKGLTIELMLNPDRDMILKAVRRAKSDYIDQCERILADRTGHRGAA